MGSISPHNQAPGLTLIELLVTLTVAALLLTVGAPSFAQLIDKVAVRAESNRLLSALMLARSEAVTRNGPVSVCPSSYESSGHALCSGKLADGWMVFSNPDKNSRFDPAVDTVIKGFAGLDRGFTLTNRQGTQDLAETLTYLRDGTARQNMTLLICAPRASTALILNRVGRPRLSATWGTCPV
jgi:type IV fimbrial biogenesis protein FimT